MSAPATSTRHSPTTRRRPDKRSRATPHPISVNDVAVAGAMRPGNNGLLGSANRIWSMPKSACR